MRAASSPHWGSPPWRRAGACVSGWRTPRCPVESSRCAPPRRCSASTVVAAVRYNALGLVAVLLLVWAFAAWTYGRLVGRRIGSWQHLRWSAPTALALPLVWFV